MGPPRPEVSGPVNTDVDTRVGQTPTEHRGNNDLVRRTAARPGGSDSDNDGRASNDGLGNNNTHDTKNDTVQTKGRSNFEMVWTTKYEFFLRKGYKLRPRYQPNWEPSWEKTGQRPQQCEDYHRLPLRPNVIDATRDSDGKLVYIKRIPSGSDELTIARSLFDLKDPTNHTVPILDVFEDKDNTNVSYMVMPFLRYTNDPPFELVDDIVDIVGQLLEGLVFMHSQGVAHRDCAYKNIMMDGTSLYPKGFHPVNTHYTPDMRKKAKPYARFTAPTPVKYYFVDFGISERFALDGASRLVTGTDGLDAEVPELSSTEPYDPFKVDIFILGNFFKKYLFDRYSNVEFLAPFVEKMTQRDPDDRPDAEELQKQWQTTTSPMTFSHRTQYLVERSSGRAASGSFLLPFLYAGPVLLVQGWFTNARWTRFVRKQD